jgi:hypothetical protein
MEDPGQDFRPAEIHTHDVFCLAAGVSHESSG